MSVAFLVTFAGFLLVLAGVKNLNFTDVIRGRGLPGAPV